MSNFAVLRTSVLAVAWALATSSSAVADTPKAVNVVAGELADALESLAKQCGVDVIYPSSQLNGLKTEGISGNFETQEAFEQLIKGTALVVRKQGGSVLIMMPPKENTARAGAGSIRFAQNENTGYADDQKSENSFSGSSSGDAGGELEEIVVTAQKRKEILQDVPISISIISGADLDSSSAQGTTEVLRTVPGVAATESNQTGGTQLTVRGVSAADPMFAGSSPIAYYLDSAPFGFVRSAIVPDPNVFDLQRIEVLRGPQGTLYGAGGQGGVVRVLTNPANPDEWEFKARTSASVTERGGANYRGDAALNVPIIDGRMAVRGVLSSNQLSGWIDSPTERDRNDADLFSGRIRVYAQPIDGLHVDLSFWRSESDYGAGSVSDENDRINALPTPITADQSVYNVTVGYEFPLFSVSSATSYLEYTNNSVLDLSGLLGLLTGVGAKSFSQEFLLNSVGDGPWQWTAGLFYRDAEETIDSFLDFYPDLEAGGAVDFGYPTLTDTSESYAVYGELRRALWNDQFELTVGLRYFQDKGVTKRTQRVGDTYEALTPRLVLAWTPSNDLSAYASYSQGFRSGLFNDEEVTNILPDLGPAEPDTLSNYEVGAKGRLFGGALNYETALYYIDWRDVQQVLGVALPGTGTDGDFTLAVVNGSSASGVGFDLALSTRVLDSLELGGTFSWNNLEFDADVFSGSKLLFAEGDRLNRSPEYTAGLFAEYGFAMGGEFEGRVSGSVNYTSPLSTTASCCGTFKSDALLISRASLAVEAPHGWIGTFFIDNLGNERSSSVVGAAPEVQSRIRPRTIGLQFEYRYGRR